MSSFHLHRRQFVIAEKPILLASDWHSTELSVGFHLSYQSDLCIDIMENEGRKIVLLGRSFPAADLASGNTRIDTCSGRFVLIEWPYICGDASLLLSIYYSQTDEGPLVSSSPALISNLSRSNILSGRHLRWGGLNWFPGPGSRVATASRLIRDQRLHIPTLAIDHIDRAVKPCQSFEAARHVMSSYLTAIFQRISDHSNKVYLALTAGLDSRTLAAALLAAGVKFEVITQNFEGVDRNDITIAGDICRSLGLVHHVIDPEPRDEAAHTIWREHTLESYCDADDTELFPDNSYRFLEYGDILVGGGIFEVGRRFYAELLQGLTYANATGQALWSRFEGDRLVDERTIIHLDQWLTWRRQHPDGLDLIDGFYLDQRVGGWLAAIEQALDTLPGTSIHPINCGAILSALVTPTASDRHSGRLQRETIAVLEPRLLRFPVNPSTLTLADYKERIVRKSKRILRRAFSH